MNTTISINHTKTDPQTHLPISLVSTLHTGSHITPVYLNFYDLGGCINTCIHSIGLSFYHCAIQTHSAEYGYMGHPYRFTGLYKTSKHDSRFHLYRLRDSMEIGWTWFNEKEIDRIVNDLKPFYLGLDYHTTEKNSIQFVKYLLEQLSNDSQLKHLESIQVLPFPSYIDRVRRLSQTFGFLQIFDTEKDIAEINILYFLYMKYKGNIKQICQIIKCDTIDKLKRSIQLIEQGIRQKKLPIFPLFSTFDMKRAYEDLYIMHPDHPDVLSTNEQLTLTDIFHQFDTITLRGRTSIDRYLNIQRNKEFVPQSQIENEQRLTVELPQVSNRPRTDTISVQNNQIKQIFPTEKYQTSSVKSNTEPPTLSHMPRSSQPQSISQNQRRTPLTSPSASNISGLAITSHNPPPNAPMIHQPTPIFLDPLLKFDHLHMRTAVPIGTVLRLQETLNPDLPLTKLHLTSDVNHHLFSYIPNRQRKLPSSSRKRKLPRDLELSNHLYTITNQNSLRNNYTNNAIPSFSPSHLSTTNIISLQKIEANEDADSSV